MEKKKPNDLSPEQCLAVDTDSLCKLLDCGRHTACLLYTSHSLHLAALLDQPVCYRAAQERRRGALKAQRVDLRIR